MRRLRGCLFLLAFLLPTSWTLAHADEMGAGGSMGGEKKKMKKKAKKKDEGGMGGMKGEMKAR
jgi:hypothetical protein